MLTQVRLKERHAGKHTYLGLHATPELASAAYTKAKAKTHKFSPS